MGTIVPRKRRNGSIGFCAQIMIRRSGEIVHRESQTFDRRQAAAAWLEAREAELAKPGALDRLREEDPLLSQVIDRYLQDSKREVSRTRAHLLQNIKSFPLAQLRCSQITSSALVDFAKAKHETGVKPQTVSVYLANLGSIFDIAKAAWRYPLDPSTLEDANRVARHLGLVKKSSRRDRRPTLDELDKLMTFFGVRSHRRPVSAPMQRVVAFAIFSARRQEEIVRLLWSDLDEAHGRILVRDMKDPRGSAENHVWCELPPEAMSIIKAMPKIADEIFPYTRDAIQKAFTSACQTLEIADLHFHDLRHEGVSRLFETGLTIPRVAAVSGHRSWHSLQRYTHVRQIGDKYADWKWLPVVTAPDERLCLTTRVRLARQRKIERSLS
jgi:integrase